MNDDINKSLFYVSNIGNNKVSIIDSESSSIIDEIRVGERPYEIALDNKNNIYIATDRNSKITIINHTNKKKISVDIPNNGHIKVDSAGERIYISDTEEVYIYSLEEKKIINTISGFIAVDCIQLNSKGNLLYILDIFKNKIVVYDTLTFKVIKTYKDIGDTLSNIFLGENNRYLFVANKGIDKMGINGNVVVIDIETDSLSNITFPKGSVLTSLVGDEDFLYVNNIGLNRIDIIDIEEKNIVDNLQLLSSKIEKINVLKKKKFLLVTSESSTGDGRLDLIDIENKKIVQTINFKEKYSNPYDIVVVRKNNYKDNKLLDSDINIKYKEKEENNIEKIEKTEVVTILSKRVLSSYKEKIIFQNEKIELISKEKISIKEIIFDECIVIEESKNKEFISGKENYMVLDFTFFIPYSIECIKLENEKVIINGKLKGKQKAVLHVNKDEINNLEFTIKANSQIITFPYIKDDSIIFDLSSIISTYVTKEEIIFIPSIEKNNRIKEGIK